MQNEVDYTATQIEELLAFMEQYSSAEQNLEHRALLFRATAIIRAIRTIGRGTQWLSIARTALPEAVAEILRLQEENRLLTGTGMQLLDVHQQLQSAFEELAKSSRKEK